MNDEQLLRYSRQIMLPEMDIAGQQRLLDATVLIVGMGGLGCPAAMYLAAAGIGHLIIADDDVVEVTNLQRQIAHSQANIGEPKVDSVQQTLLGLNPAINITALNRRLLGEDLQQIVSQADLVVDACDNFSTRFAINRSCLKHRKPMVSGAAIRMEGQVAVFDSRDADSPCYQCLYCEGGEEGGDEGGEEGGDEGGYEGGDEDMTCSTNGVMAPLVGIIGAVQAMETIKLLAGIGSSLCGRLLLLDATTLQWREMTLLRDSQCGACGE